MELLRRRSRPIAEAAQGPYLVPPWTPPRRHRLGQELRPHQPGQTALRQTGTTNPAALPHHDLPATQTRTQRVRRERLRPLTRRRSPTTPRPIVLIWDNVNIHIDALMRRLIEARPWLTVFRLPAYAPELNPMESVWSHLKRSLSNLAPSTLDDLANIIPAGPNGCSTDPTSWTPSRHTPA
ncbi:transposase [Nonomuraea salmonea]|uniref:Transposase n=1 Tax=Nonomuraea salmonea TaxID=46181 RepID=A0ABV5NP29_9ACTN